MDPVEFNGIKAPVSVRECETGQLSKTTIALPEHTPPGSNSEPGVESKPPEIGSNEGAVTAKESFFGEEQAQEVFEVWMLSQPYYARRMLAVLLAEMFRRRYELGQVAASQEAAIITGWSDQTVRRFRKEFYANNGELKVGRGNSNKLKVAPKKIKTTSRMTKEHSKVKGHRKPRKK